MRTACGILLLLLLLVVLPGAQATPGNWRIGLNWTHDGTSQTVQLTRDAKALEENWTIDAKIRFEGPFGCAADTDYRIPLYTTRSDDPVQAEADFRAAAFRIPQGLYQEGWPTGGEYRGVGNISVRVRVDADNISDGDTAHIAFRATRPISVSAADACHSANVNSAGTSNEVTLEFQKEETFFGGVQRVFTPAPSLLVVLGVVLAVLVGRPQTS